MNIDIQSASWIAISIIILAIMVSRNSYVCEIRVQMIMRLYKAMRKAQRDNDGKSPFMINDFNDKNVWGYNKMMCFFWQYDLEKMCYNKKFWNFIKDIELTKEEMI